MTDTAFANRQGAVSVEPERKCRACEKLRPIAEFYVRKDTGRPRGLCIACTAAKNSDYYAQNTEQHAAVVKKRYDEVGRFERYGITGEIYQHTLDRQGHACALCRSPKPGGKGKWHIDHRHDGSERRGKFNQCADGTRFRGVLCHRCNIALGHYEKLVEKVGLDRLLGYLGGGLNVPSDAQPQAAPPVRIPNRAGA